MREKDPDGIAPGEPGAKLDAGKPMAELLGDFGLALLEVAKVATFGANKYSRGGWQHVAKNQERYSGALWRHLLIEHIEETAPDSGLLHEAHVAWNALARLELKLRARMIDETGDYIMGPGLVLGPKSKPYGEGPREWPMVSEINKQEER